MSVSTFFVKLIIKQGVDKMICKLVLDKQRAFRNLYLPVFLKFQYYIAYGLVNRALEVRLTYFYGIIDPVHLNDHQGDECHAHESNNKYDDLSVHYSKSMV